MVDRAKRSRKDNLLLGRRVTHKKLMDRIKEHETQVALIQQNSNSSNELIPTTP